ncbi:MAG: hypothetical protein RIE31_08040 [Alphaproteobacteria bacterium]
MDAFETLVSEIFWRKGFWVQNNLKVELTKEEKRKIGRPTAPRWELDVVAYKGGLNELLVVECKSYIDWVGVSFAAFEEGGLHSSRYKLFNDSTLRTLVLDRLKQQLCRTGLVAANPTITLALACEKIRNDKDREKIRAHFDTQGWELFDEAWLQDELKEMSKGSYENSAAAVVAKLLLRNRQTRTPTV